MEVTRLTKRNHYEEITEQLRQQIAEGKLKVGDKLPSTKEMSERFGVGRSTTREALSALKAMGLIEIRQGGGCRVIRSAAAAPGKPELPELDSLRLNRGTLLELLEVRQTLEVANAAAAAGRRTDEDLRRFAALMTEMGGAVGRDLEGERTDLQFHLALAQATHNSLMVRLFETIASQLESSIRDIRRVEMYADQQVSQQLYLEHSAIYDAVRAQDGERAATMMKRHLQHVEAILTKYI